MKLLRFYRRTRFFLLVNITGLAIGFAVAIMLLLFIVNALSYDRHFANKERIIRLNSILGDRDISINLRKAYTIPETVPGIDAAVQIYTAGAVEATVEQIRFHNLRLLHTDTEFFEVFRMKFVEGTTDALKTPNSLVLTRRHADIMFGDSGKAIGNQISIGGNIFTVTGVVEELPLNTHFSFDVLTNIPEYVKSYGGLEFHTYYLISNEAVLDVVRKNIETEYNSMLTNRFPNYKVSCYTEKLTDIYLHSKSASNLARSDSMSKIWSLSLIAIFILLLAITNFVNLFITHGEARMKEIGIRKANGAGVGDIVRQFFSEVSAIVFIAFALGFWLSILVTPYFSQLINTEVTLSQLINPAFITCVIMLFVLTVVLSAGYPAFYLSRFNPLDILYKRVKLSKRRLTAGVVIFQSIITLVLLSYILVINKQTQYLENLSKGYNPANVVAIGMNRTLHENYSALKQELTQIPSIQKISGSDHIIGGGCSGQGIALLEDNTKEYGINEYRVMPDLCELIELQLVEGNFLREEDRQDIRTILLNEAAVRMLGLKQPIAGQYVNYKGDVNTKVLGVVKNFYYDTPSNKVQPLVISFCFREIGYLIYLKFNENISRSVIIELLNNVFHKFDPEFNVDPVWSEDIYNQKFDNIKTHSNIILHSTLLSLFIVILGLFATHLYATVRRTKEIGIRRIYGADSKVIFMLLSSSTLKWIAVAALIAIPGEYFLISRWLENYANRTSLDVIIFLLPVLIQCIIALAISFGLTMWILSRNPVNALKSE
jgi:putative ABC transport system permease protein